MTQLLLLQNPSNMGYFLSYLIYRNFHTAYTYLPQFLVYFGEGSVGAHKLIL